ncbi:hypothetical protein CANCADRAFT_32732 [Tortispora caseinolytica NRRL Y-17796]|uniref:alcohol dehydrogenase (NADP(+)) n=1 Tax=Tortispora caseinolytica NRRL Y-17796 TaxID=767744 RepID=A0A1E4TCX6_9ASCO|nr:hypothetical protein CANCADRAFT_32732 [Tortispora caseinolytica NRRL Y-17796]
MVYPDTFEGFFVESPETWTKPKRREFTPKKFGDSDIDIEIEVCGICGSDVHTASGGWGRGTYPICVGHEIVGKALRVGPAVKSIKVGDRVGVGAQILSCLECDDCKNDNEQYCANWINTYGGVYEDGTVAQGGYSSHIRAHELYVFPIPDEIESKHACVMLCAGITTYSPLVRNGCGPGSKVGVVGIGGLGHFAILWAKALGAEVTVFSRTDKKKEDAFKLGADHFIATEKPGWADANARSLNLIINTANSSAGFNLNDYIKTLKVSGRFISVGLPEGGGFSLSARNFLKNSALFGSSHIGSKKEILEMLDLAVKKNVTPMVECIPISESGCGEGLERCYNNQCRYRIVLTDYDKAFAR